MTTQDLAFSIRTLRELFPKAELNDSEIALWTDNLACLDRETAVHAIRTHRVTSDKPWPVLAKVLELARVKAQDQIADDSPKSVEWAAHADRCRQDDDAALRLLESLTQQDLDELAAEGRRIGGGHTNAMFPIPFRLGKASRFSRGLMAAAFAMSPKFGKSR